MGEPNTYSDLDVIRLTYPYVSDEITSNIFTFPSEACPGARKQVENS